MIDSIANVFLGMSDAEVLFFVFFAGIVAGLGLKELGDLFMNR